MRRIRYLIVLLILSAAMAAVLGGYGVFAAGEPAGGVTTSTEVFKKVSGAYQGYSYEEPMATDGLSVSVSVDVPSGSFAYFGINAGPGGKGQPVSAQHGIGILLYNSVDLYLAIEVYSGYAWHQYTTTTEILDISPTQTVTLSLKKEEGEWGLYINGTLFTGVARDTFGDVAAGSEFNPVAYIDEAEFSSQGKSYIEAGTWDRGGSITLYRQKVSGHFDVVDRDNEAIEGLRITGAYNASGDVISLLSNRVQDGDFEVTTLSGDAIEALMVETAGGVSRTIVPGERTVIRAGDVRLRVSDGEDALGGAELQICRGGEEITGYIKTGYAQGVYILEDIGAEIEVRIRRAGFETQTVLLSPGGEVAVDLTPQEFSVRAEVRDAFTGRTLSVPAQYLRVDPAAAGGGAVQILSDGETLTIEGLSGNVDGYFLRMEGFPGYTDSEVSLKNAYGGNIVLYTSAVYDSILTLADAEGGSVSGAEVVCGDRVFLEQEGVYTLTGVSGDQVVSIEKSGYVPQQILITSESAVRTVTLKRSQAVGIAIGGVEDGTKILYTINGLSRFEGAVSGGMLMVEGGSAGDRITLSAQGYYFPVDTIAISDGSVLSAERIYTVTVRFTYNGSPVAGAAVRLDRAEYVTDEDGAVVFDAVGEQKVIVGSVQGYTALSASDLEIDGAHTQFSVELSGRIYTATVTLKDEQGNILHGKKVKIGERYAEKTAQGVYFAEGLTGENTVTVDGEEVTGKVTETETDIVLVIKSAQEDAADTPKQPAAGCSSSATAAILPLSAAVLAAAAALLGKRRQRP